MKIRTFLKKMWTLEFPSPRSQNIIIEWVFSVIELEWITLSKLFNDGDLWCHWQRCVIVAVHWLQCLNCTPMLIWVLHSIWLIEFLSQKFYIWMCSLPIYMNMFSFLMCGAIWNDIDVAFIYLNRIKINSFWFNLYQFIAWLFDVLTQFKFLIACRIFFLINSILFC